MENTNKSAASELPCQVFCSVTAFVSKDVCEKVPPQKLSKFLIEKGSGVNVSFTRPPTYTLQGSLFQIREAEGILLDQMERYKHRSIKNGIGRGHCDIHKPMDGVGDLVIGSHDHYGAKPTAASKELKSAALDEASESSDKPNGSPDKQKRNKRHNYENQASAGNITQKTSLSKNPANTSSRWPSGLKGQHMVSTYKSLQGHVAVHVYFADITTLHVDAIVNAANKKLGNSGGVAGAIAKAAGDELRSQCHAFIKRNGNLGVSQTIVTGAGRLPCSNVIHTVGPQYKQYDDPEGCVIVLAETFRNCFKFAEQYRFKSIAIPAISSGRFGVPLPMVSQTMYTVCKEFCDIQGETCSLTDIHLVDINQKHLRALNCSFKEDPSSFCLHYDVQQGTSLGIHEEGTAEADAQQLWRTKESQPMHNNQPRPTKSDDPNDKSRMRNSQAGKQISADKNMELVNSIGVTSETPPRESTQKQGSRRGRRQRSVNSQLQDTPNIQVVEKRTVVLRQKANDTGPGGMTNQSGYRPSKTNIKQEQVQTHRHAKVISSYSQSHKVEIGSADADVSPNTAGFIDDEWVHPTGTRVNYHGEDVHQNGTGVKSKGAIVQPKDESLKSNKKDQNGAGVTSIGEDVYTKGTEINSNYPPSKPPRKCRNKKGNPTHIPQDGNTNTEERNDSRSSETVDNCPICFDEFPIEKLKRLRCKHVFCDSCFNQAFAMKPVCPVCGEIYGVVIGTQPDGHMTWKVDNNLHLPGFKKTRGTIVIYYDFSNGEQGNNHPRPGRRYSGTSRTAYLPDNKEGRSVLNLLERAFHSRLVFTVGTSTTTGMSDQVTWNDIHHKTNIEGGPSGFGYPDDTYLSRVREELAAKGIK